MRIFSRIGLLAAVAGMAVAGQVATAQAADEYGFQPGTPSLSLSTAQAGGHPDLTLGFTVAQDGTGRTVASTRDVVTDLPVGLVGNPTNMATCSMPNVVRMMASVDQANNSQACPRDAAVGYATIRLRYPFFPFGLSYRQRIYRLPTDPGEPAAFGTSVVSLPVRMTASVRSDGDYGLTVSGVQLPESELLDTFDATFWGVPADHQGIGTGTDLLWDGNPAYMPPAIPAGSQFGGPLAGAARTPFLSNPGYCPGTPLVTKLSLRSWAAPSTTISTDLSTPAITGCDQLKFEPSIVVKPDTRAAGQPSGYRVDLSVPQTNSADELSTPNLKDAVVTMPEGVALSPTVADGLDACTDAQLAIKSRDRESCPLSSKIGTVDIDSPLLDDPLSGSLYVGQQLSHDPESGKMYRIFVTAYASGVRIKLRGAVKADANTGQLTTSFVDNPQLPFSKFSLYFRGGDRAPLVNPTTCGAYTATGTLSSWGGQSKGVSSSFAIDRSCPTGRFSPSFNAGMTGPWAGAFSPFTMTVSRTDADQDLSRINLTMPSGLLGALGSVPLCSPSQAGGGTCPESTRIGSTQVAVGSGGHPFFLPGKVYVSGPYKGAPFSLSIVVPAKAGPYDLGTVVVRAQLRVDAAHAQVAAVSDPLPTIVGGVPIHMRMVNVTLDRPNFMFNATSCERMSVGGAFASTSGTISTVPVPYQARRCNGLKLQPSLKIGLSGSKEFKKGGHPKLHADLSQTFGQTGLKQVKVVLPAMLALAADNAQALCKPEQAAARACPEGSIVGHATARTPALHLPLSGPVYFVENTRTSKEGRKIKTLPKLWLNLNGEGVALDLWASSEIDSSRHPQRLVTTFENVPDAPIAGFQLDIDGGKHGILASTDQVCALSRKDRKAEVTFSGQNDGKLGRRVTISPTDCGLDAVSKSVDGKRAKVRVSGLGAGKLTISGKGIRKHSRTIKHATAATIAAKLTKSGRHTANARKALRLKVSFNPKAKGKKTVSIKTTVKQAKKSASRGDQTR